MKKWFDKIKTNFKNATKGFSLVELIVVIAIMAVMAAVLAPALLGYVERSRAQKDYSAMGEVTNAIQLSLADQNVYDEMLKYSAEQYSCYVDSDSPDDANKVDIKAGKYYMYSDEERQLDETVYKLDGVMRGVTITFAPDAAASNSATLDLIKGHVNKYLPSGKKTYGGLTGATASPKLADIPESELYNSLRATIGDKINISSQTYRNSEYTIFISMGTTGGQEAAQQDAIKVWGQFSGTNLPEGSSVAGNTATGSNEFKEPTNGGNTPVVTFPSKGKTLEEYTWAEVQQIVQAGKATEYGFAVGQTKTLQVNDTTYTSILIGLNHDGTIMDKTATFMFKQSVFNDRFNRTPTNTGGWRDSTIRNLLNNSFYQSISEETRKCIKQVNKTTNNRGYGGTSGTLSSTQDYLFLLSATEINKNQQYSVAGEGHTYAYFSGSFNFQSYTWLRSPNYNSSQNFYQLQGNRVNTASATTVYGICPAFVIG